MSDEEFLLQFVEALGADPGSVSLDTPLRTIEVWDSVAYLNVMALVDDRLGVALNPESLVSADTPRAILDQARKGVAI
jgi:acyl carrier protein